MEISLAIALGVLFFGGGLAYWSLRRKLLAQEEVLQEMAPLSLLPDRLQALAKIIEDLDPEQVRTEFERMHENLLRIEDLAAAPTAEGAKAPSRPQIVRALVLRWLRDEGYYSVRIRNEDSELDSQEVSVVVEAVRRGLLLRGSIQVQGDQVAEAALDPSYSMFP
ncbi:MAG: hypothetical protein OTJ44_02835 [Planctomycetota bacterium]|nr:hypothetical protein [Planctomycetota bacterium]